jgi:hypothetical protein
MLLVSIVQRCLPGLGVGADLSAPIRTTSTDSLLACNLTIERGHLSAVRTNGFELVHVGSGGLGQGRSS